MSDSGQNSSDLIAGSSSQDCVKSSNEISQSSGHNVSLKRSAVQEREEEPPDPTLKRPRGPYDCLNWDDSDEDEVFTPFTQENPPISPGKVFAKKSSANKGSAKKSSVKNSRAKNRKKSTSKEKGKSLGMFVLHCFYVCVLLIF